MIIKTAIADNIYLHYIGPSYYNRKISEDNKTIFYSNLSLGFVSYTDYAELFQKFNIHGENVGINVGLGVDFLLGPSNAFFIGTSFSRCTISKVKITSSNGSVQTITLDSDKISNMSRIDLSVGIKWQ